jgi:hypothetical protein
VATDRCNWHSCGCEPPRARQSPGVSAHPWRSTSTACSLSSTRSCAFHRLPPQAAAPSHRVYRRRVGRGDEPAMSQRSPGRTGVHSRGRDGATCRCECAHFSWTWETCTVDTRRGSPWLAVDLRSLGRRFWPTVAQNSLASITCVALPPDYPAADQILKYPPPHAFSPTLIAYSPYAYPFRSFRRTPGLCCKFS